MKGQGAVGGKQSGPIEDICVRSKSNRTKAELCRSESEGASELQNQSFLQGWLLILGSLLDEKA